MINENKFITGVWEKYDKYEKKNSKDNFFKKHLYKNTEFKLKLQSICASIAIILVMAGGVYAYVNNANKVQEPIVQNHTLTESKKKIFNHSEVMEDERYGFSKKVTTYQEYLEYLEIWNGLIEMDESDFKNNFVLILNVEGGSYIKTIEDDDDNLYIILKMNEYSLEDEIISTKISKKHENKDIKIAKVPGFDSFKNYTSAENITKSYSKEDAVRDNCVVIENFKLVSPNNKNVIDDFIENVQEESTIRIVHFYDSISEEDESETYRRAVFVDILYRNQKYHICTYAYDEYGVLHTGNLSGVGIGKGESALDNTIGYYVYFYDETGHEITLGSTICSFEK